MAENQKIFSKLTQMCITDLGNVMIPAGLDRMYVERSILDPLDKPLKGKKARKETPFLTVTFQGAEAVGVVSWRQRKTTFEVVAAAGINGHVANAVAGIADRIRHLGGGSILLEAIPSARGRWEAQGFVPVPGEGRRMQRRVEADRPTAATQKPASEDGASEDLTVQAQQAVAKLEEEKRRVQESYNGLQAEVEQKQLAFLQEKDSLQQQVQQAQVVAQQTVAEKQTQLEEALQRARQLEEEQQAREDKYKVLQAEAEEKLQQQLQEAQQCAASLHQMASEEIQRFRAEMSCKDEQVNSEVRQKSALQKQLQEALAHARQLEEEKRRVQENYNDIQVQQLKDKVAELEEQRAGPAIMRAAHKACRTMSAVGFRIYVTSVL